MMGTALGIGRLCSWSTKGIVCWDLLFMSGNGGRYALICYIGAVFLGVLGGQEE